MHCAFQASTRVIYLIICNTLMLQHTLCRGTVNPETGMMRLACGDSVAWANYGGFDPALVTRLQGAIGQKYTVECPDNCKKGSGVWGCNPFMDESSVCQAAVGMGRIPNKVGGIVSFQIVEPEKEWKSCRLQEGINTDKWTWYEWKKADRPEQIARRCTADWVADHPPNDPCPEVKQKYRQNCKVNNGVEHCFGARAISFLEAAPAPTMSPNSGVFFGEVSISVRPAAGYTAACTTDGTLPNAADPEPGSEVDGSMKLTNDGNYVVKCQAISETTGGSAIVEQKYRLLTVSPTPTFSPNGGLGVVGNITVEIATDIEGTVIHFTTDGTQASESSPVYSVPIEIKKNGAVLHAMSVHAQLDNSGVVASEPFVVTAVPPSPPPNLPARSTPSPTHPRLQVQEGQLALCLWA